ncbi:hypothetical protein TanjilG_03892 [Lupinus angustifolius]|uniref:Protein kinase domain-containing protein n=1 Tax=Lupinus angustifolius TaxID=3871 RepID=A0A4P1R4K9_LUPAN|nr:PREDICTED: uncharacterized protein LOC109359312 [Lupinus angustifolius]XP_019459474.1 PREDICTED: uncharacterized protein LOC109359312 [Lupinus angustifolius]OIW01754.1 hypothetical protein TanjilG_03892 [Lupinus angustifolius]
MNNENEAPGVSGDQYNDTLSFGSGDRISSDNDVDNICLQTGEEFSAEFLRDRVGSRRFPVTPDADQRLPNRLDFNTNNNNYQLVYEDLNHVLGLRRMDSDGNSDLSEFGLARYVAEVDNGAYHNNLSGYQCENVGIRQVSGTFSRQVSGKFSEGICCDRVTSGLTAPPIYVFDSPQSCYPYGSQFSEGSFYKKIKFLCSFGGRILPRPNDGKLRYVGGETRIISIRKNITWEEFMRKTSAVCNQAHIIKYQLPGEDLDALISVCSDEDLHHMIEEYEELERAGGTQRLRIFLIPSNEPESPNSNEARVNQPSDADYHYVVAVNGMLDPSPRKNSGQSLASHSSQFGNSPDYSPSFRRDSPTSAFALEMKDCNPTSANLVSILSKPGHHVLSALQIPGKSFNQTPHLSPIHKDPKISNIRLYHQPYNAVNESIAPFAMEKVPSDNSLYVDNANYVDPIAYYNNIGQGSPCVNYHPSNQYFVEADQFKKPDGDFRIHIRNHSKDLVSSATRGQNNMMFERPLVTNEGSYQFEKVVSHPHESSSLFPVSNDRDGSQYRRLRSPSGSPLQEIVEKSQVHLQFPHRVERDKLLETSNSSEQCPILPGETIDWKEQVGMYQIFPTFGMADSCKGASNNGKEKLQNKDKSNDWFDENVESLSRKCAIDIKHSQCMNYQHGVSLSSPDLQSSECDVSAAPFSSLESARNPREQPHGLPLEITGSEFSMRSQMSSMHDQYAMPETKDGQPFPLGSYELQHIESQTKNESILPISYMGVSSTGDVIIPDEGHACYLHHKKENTVDKQQSSTNIDEFYVNKPETGAVLKGSNDCTSSGIQSCSQVASNVREEIEVGPTSPGKEETESVSPESENEHAKAGSGNFNKPDDDTSTAETEAEIFGLQIIENADVEELQELGSGTFGTVYHGKWRGTDVAIKRIKSSCFSGRLSEQERLTKDFWREAKILSALHHPNVVAFYGVVPNGPGGTLATVTEYMVHGSLRNVLMKKEKVLDRRKRLMIAMDAAFGMEYLHLKNIVHFDLKCDNFLVNLGDPERPVCKVGDFGLSRIKRNTLVSGGVRGTLPWMAPELLYGNSSRVSEKVDIFSFGIAMWEILTGEEPYANMHCGAIIGGIVNNTLRPPIPKRCDSEWKKLMEECWSPDPEARPSFTEIKDRLCNMSAALQKKRHHLGHR